MACPLKSFAPCEITSTGAEREIQKWDLRPIDAIVKEWKE